MLVGASCTGELIQDDPGGLARALNLPIPVVPLDLPSYQRKENWGASETFYQLVRAMAGPSCARRPARPGRRAPSAHPPRCNILGPSALGFRHRDDVTERSRACSAAWASTWRSWRRWAQARRIWPGSARPTSTSCCIPRSALTAASSGWSALRTTRHPHGADRRLGHARLHRRGRGPGRGRSRPAPRSRREPACPGIQPLGRLDLPHRASASSSSATPPTRSPPPGSRPRKLGFTVVGLGTYAREFAREVREAAKLYGVEPLITDDYLEVEAKPSPNCSRNWCSARRWSGISPSGSASAARSSRQPVHVQDFPARYSPQMGFEGRERDLFDSWVHPLMMGLEEHLLGMFREDSEFHDGGRPVSPGRGDVELKAPAGRSEQAAAIIAGLPRPRRKSTRSRSSCEARPGGIPNASPRTAASPSSRSRPCTMPKRISVAERDASPASCHRHDGQPPRPARSTGARAKRCRRDLPGPRPRHPRGRRMGQRRRGVGALPDRHRGRRHRHRHHAVPGRPYPGRPARTGGPPRCLRCHALLPCRPARSCG